MLESGAGTIHCARVVEQTAEVVVGQDDGVEVMGQLVNVEIAAKVAVFDRELGGPGSEKGWCPNAVLA